MLFFIFFVILESFIVIFLSFFKFFNGLVSEVILLVVCNIEFLCKFFMF